MRILVLGAGGTGGYFGGRMAEAGLDVTFLVRERRAAQLAARGLIVRSHLGDMALPVKTVLEAGSGGPYSAILLSCKAYDLAGAIEAVAPALGPTSIVVPLLNGMAHLDALDARFGRGRVLGALCRISATLTADGEVHHLNDLHDLVFGPRDRQALAPAAELAAVLRPARMNASLSAEIEREMWEKFVFISALAGMTCLMRASVGDIMATDDGRALTERMVDTCRRVAESAGFAPPASAMAGMRAALLQPRSGFMASLLRDIERGGPIEGEHILGDMQRRAAAAGIADALLAAAHCHVQAYEARRARESSGAA